MDFSDIYYEGGQAFITVKNKAGMFSDLASLNNPNVSVGAQNGTIQMDLAQQYSPKADIVTLTKATDIIAELVSGKLDGGYVEYDVAVAYQANYPELHIVCEVPYEVEGNAVGVVKGNAALLAGVNEAIAACIKDGSFSQFVADALEQASGNIYEGLLEDK
jgi:polar amino acid transport system substrate-binding protein